MLDMSKLKKYKVSDLYFLKIGFITYANSSYICDSKPIPRSVLIAQKVPHNNQYLKTIITKTLIYDFHNCYNSKDEFIGKVMFSKAIPLSQLISDKEKISLFEIQKIEQELNTPLVSKEESHQFYDSVLKTIKDLNQNAKLINDETKRNALLEEIKALAVYYVSNLFSIKDNKDRNLTLNDLETTLKLEILNKINTLEFQIEQELKNNNIRQDLAVILERTL